MSVRDFCISQKGKNRKSVDINDRLICKYIWSTKRRNRETIADRLAGGERKRDEKRETPTR